MSDEKAIVPVVNQGLFLAPAAALSTVLTAYQVKKDFIDTVLKDGVDFATIPGAKKAGLMKAGAEKMATLFALAPVFEDVETVEDWTGQNHGGEPFFYYRQKCKLYRGEWMVGSADGSCNSRETKYRYRWVGETEIPAGLDKSTLKTQGGRISEFTFAIDKAETSGRYGKPASYWQKFKDAMAANKATRIMKKTKTGQSEAYEIDATLYRIPNDDIAEQVNTILKMAQKRALVAAVLIATNASDYFTQDIEDFVQGDVMNATFVDEPKATTTVTVPGGIVENATQNLGAKVTEQRTYSPDAIINGQKMVETVAGYIPTDAWDEHARRIAEDQNQNRKPANGNGNGKPRMMATVGKNKWPVDWMNGILAENIPGVKPFEIGGALEKLTAAQVVNDTMLDEVVIGATVAYLNARHNENPLNEEEATSTAQEYVTAVMNGQTENN